MTKATPIIHDFATITSNVMLATQRARGCSARAEPHPIVTTRWSDRGASRAAVLVKPLAGGHSSGAPALPYGIGVGDVPNHAEHITSRGAPKKLTTIRRVTRPLLQTMGNKDRGAAGCQLKRRVLSPRKG